ncbi:hypothetical protein ASwh1_390 [Aeromonas phage Aswh_1]|nr:hypothetical protein ASwh1_390 [Aeromonas phage Aswh_1]
MTKLESVFDISKHHPYYCSIENYSDSSWNIRWETMTDFLNEFKDADVDMNLVFRWDVKHDEDDHGGYYAQVFMIHQRKGAFSPHFIKSIEEHEVDEFIEFLNKHKETINKLWNI